MSDIRHSIQISAPPETVYPLVASGAGFTKWWAADVHDEGVVTELAFFNRTTVYRLRLRTNEPPYRAEWIVETGEEWGGTELRFLLEPAGSGTQLRFTHAGWKSETDYFISCTTVWGELMFRLKAAAEGYPRGPLFLQSSLAY